MMTATRGGEPEPVDRAAGFAQVLGAPVILHTGLSKRLGSVKAALLLGTVLWREGWVFRSAGDLRADLGLSYREQQTARDLLVAKGLIEVKRGRGGVSLRFLWAGMAELLTGGDNPVDKPGRRAESRNALLSVLDPSRTALLSVLDVGTGLAKCSTTTEETTTTAKAGNSFQRYQQKSTSAASSVDGDKLGAGARLLAKYHDLFVAKHGEKPVIQGGKDGRSLKGLATRYGEATVGEMLEQFISTTDAFAERSGYSLSAFMVSVNRLLLARKDRRKETNAGYRTEGAITTSRKTWPGGIPDGSQPRKGTT